MSRLEALMPGGQRSPRSALRSINAIPGPVAQNSMGGLVRKSLGASFSSIGTALVMLVACGGGSIPGLDSDELFDWFYGSIAVNPDTLAIAITANQPSQETADSKAMDLCGGGACDVVLRYSGKGSCAAIARASNYKYGIGEGSRKSVAMSKALEECLAQGGKDCEPGLAECNG